MKHQEKTAQNWKDIAKAGEALCWFSAADHFQFISKIVYYKKNSDGIVIEQIIIFCANAMS